MSAGKALVDVFRDSLGLAPEVTVESLRYGESKGWDSLAHMQLVSQLEGHFDIMLETQDVLDMSSFIKAKEILGRYGVDASS